MLRLVLSCVWAALTAALCYAAATVKAPQIEEDIRARTAAVIAPQDQKVEVTVDGRFVTLRGLAASEEAKGRHLAAADGVYGALGPTDALWLAAAQKASHYFSAAKSADGSVTLSGLVPNAAARDEIASAATSVFKEAVANRIIVSDAADSQALPPAADAIGALAALDQGLLLVSPEGVTLSGAAGSAIAAATVSGAETAAAAGAPWRVLVAGPAGLAGSALAVAKTPDGVIEARGALSSEAAKTAVLQALGAGGVKVIDLLTVRGAGLPQDWDAKALSGASAITKLDWGSLSMDAEKSSLRGAGPQGEMSAIRGDLGDAWTKDLIVRAETAEPDAQAEIEQLRASRGDLEAQLAKLRQAAAAQDIELAALKAAPPAAEPEAAPAAQPQAVCAGDIAKLLEAGTIKFDPGSAAISKSAFGLIKKLAAAAMPCMQPNAALLVISGHTDDQGSPESNLDLSRARAEAVRRAFAAIGLSAEAMDAKGFGESQPVADNASEEGRQANRRIAFDWVSK